MSLIVDVWPYFCSAAYLSLITIQFLALPSNKRPYDEALHFQYRRINNNYHGSNVPRILTCPIGSRSGA